MFNLKGIHLLCSAILFLQFTYYGGAIETDVSLGTSLAGAANAAREAAGNAAQEAAANLQASTQGLYQGSDSDNSNFDSYNVFDDTSSYFQNELPSQYNAYSDLFGNFANDGLQYGVNGLKAKIDFEKSLIENGYKAAQKAGDMAKAGFQKSVDVGNSVFGYGVEGLKKKMEFEKALLDQGMKSAQSAGGLFKSGLGKSFNAASKFGGGFSNFGGNLFRQGSNTFNRMLTPGAFGYGVGSSSGSGLQMDTEAETGLDGIGSMGLNIGS